MPHSFAAYSFTASFEDLQALKVSSDPGTGKFRSGKRLGVQTVVQRIENRFQPLRFSFFAKQILICCETFAELLEIPECDFQTSKWDQLGRLLNLAVNFDLPESTCIGTSLVLWFFDGVSKPQRPGSFFFLTLHAQSGLEEPLYLEARRTKYRYVSFRFSPKNRLPNSKLFHFVGCHFGRWFFVGFDFLRALFLDARFGIGICIARTVRRSRRET